MFLVAARLVLIVGGWYRSQAQTPHALGDQEDLLQAAKITKGRTTPNLFSPLPSTLIISLQEVPVGRFSHPRYHNLTLFQLSIIGSTIRSNPAPLCPPTTPRYGFRTIAPAAPSRSRISRISMIAYRNYFTYQTSIWNSHHIYLDPSALPCPLPEFRSLLGDGITAPGHVNHDMAPLKSSNFRSRDFRKHTLEPVIFLLTLTLPDGLFSLLIWEPASHTEGRPYSMPDPHHRS